MKAVLQRVSHASVEIDGAVHGAVGQGYLILLGVTTEDTRKEMEYLAEKVVNLRVFEDEGGKMNLSIRDIGGEMLIISQFTLCANARKGNRPSFIAAARPEQAIPLYEGFVQAMREKGISKVETGIFGAEMKVSLLNDGPVTILLDTDEIMPRG